MRGLFCIFIKASDISICLFWTEKGFIFLIFLLFGIFEFSWLPYWLQCVVLQSGKDLIVFCQPSHKEVKLKQTFAQSLTDSIGYKAIQSTIKCEGLVNVWLQLHLDWLGRRLCMCETTDQPYRLLINFYQHSSWQDSKTLHFIHFILLLLLQCYLWKLPSQPGTFSWFFLGNIFVVQKR